MTDSRNDRSCGCPSRPTSSASCPTGLRYEHFDADGDLPDSADEVELYVLPYRFRPADGEVLARLPNAQGRADDVGRRRAHRRLRARGRDPRNGRGIHDTSTAELTLTLILASLRGIPEFVRDQDRAQWKPVTRESLADKQVLIVGYGQIGEAIEARVLPFEARGGPGRAQRPGRRTRHRRAARPAARGRRRGADRARDRGDHGALRRRDAGAPQGRRAAGQHRARPGRRHRRAARRADRGAHPRRPRRRRPRAAARRTTRCGAPRTC